jgi:flagellar protein FlgJ
MSDILTTAALPPHETEQSLQNRLRELRSGLDQRPEQDKAKLRKACEDFEAVFIGQIWKQMRSSVPSDGMLHSKEEQSYLSMFDQEMSIKMARSGGIGLSDMLYDNLSERLLNASRNTESSGPLNPLKRVADHVGSGQRVPGGGAGTLAALAAQREAEKLALSIERAHGPAGTGDAGVSDAAELDLEEALRVVRMDDGGDI